MKAPVAVLGEGAWGTVLAQVLAQNGHPVRLWCYHPDVADHIKKNRRNETYLPGIKLSPLIHPSADMHEVVQGVSRIFEAIPTQFLRSVVEQARPYCHQDQVWVILSKGIEESSLLLPTQIIQQVCSFQVPVVVLSGPSFARDLAREQLTAVVIAADDRVRAQQVCTLVATDYLKPYVSSDVVGVQACAAFKNIIALGVGLVAGAGYGENTRAYMMTRGLQEMALFVRSFGGCPQTVFGLAGVGDTVLTSMGSMSRNVQAGGYIARGMTIDELRQKMAVLPEGITTLGAAHSWMCQKKIKLPLSEKIFEVIHKKKTVPAMLEYLMQQPFDVECLV